MDAMNQQWNRRQVLQRLAAVSTGLMLPDPSGVVRPFLRLGLQDDIEVQIVSLSPHTFRLSILPVKNGQVMPVPSNGCLVRDSWATPIAKLHGEARAQTIKLGNLTLQFSPRPLTLTVTSAGG